MSLRGGPGGKPIVVAGRSLETYLKDHLAGSTGGVSLARQIADGADDDAARRQMEGIADDIEADRDQLVALMARLDVQPSRVKQAGAWIGEKFGRIKLNTTAAERRVLQYEAMIMGVTGKLELWRSLGSAGVDGLDREQLKALEQRAEDQRRRLESLHDAAAVALIDER